MLYLYDEESPLSWVARMGAVNVADVCINATYDENDVGVVIGMLYVYVVTPESFATPHP
jgi:hypothetical protein